MCVYTHTHTHTQDNIDGRVGERDMVCNSGARFRAALLARGLFTGL